MNESRTTALLLSGDDDLTAQVASALGRVEGLERLRRVGTLAQAITALESTRFAIILADPRVADASVTEVAEWLRGRDEPGLLVIVGRDVGVWEGAQDIVHEVVVPSAHAGLLAAAVRRVLTAPDRRSAEDWRDRIAVVRHEIATPLMAIEGFLDVLRAHGDRLPEERRRASLDAALRNVGRLRRLVTDLNAAAKASAPVIRTSLQMVPLRSTLLRTIRDLGPLGDRVTVHVETGVRIRVDTDALQAIVSNLVSNAFKYGASPVELRARAIDDHVEIAVVDHGAGVPEGFRPHLFERYQRADESRDDAPGSGLGLWLCARLASAMGGELRHEADEDGNRFVLSVLGGRSEQPEPDEDDELDELDGLEQLVDLVGAEGGAERTSQTTRRAVIGGLEVVRDGLEAHTTVGLAVGERSSYGRAVGAASTGSGLRAVARATLDAILPFIDEDVSFDVEHVRVEGYGDDEYVMVTVTAVSGRGFERIAGVAFTRGDRARAALRATLDALNRRIEPLLV